MITIDQLDIDGKSVIGLKVDLPNAPLLIIKYKEVIIGCGYFDIEVLEKLGHIACTVSGVRTFDDILEAEIKEATSGAMDKGAKIGMVVRRFISSLKV